MPATTNADTVDRRAQFRLGAQDILPILIGVIPFGLVFGAVSIESGFTLLDTIGFLLIVFAGASQLAAVELLANDASLAVAVLTIAVINLRHLMYSASLAPNLAGVPLRMRIFGMFFLTDQAYAVTIIRAPQSPNTMSTFWYYLGAAVPLYVNWQFWTIVGAVAGAAIPDSVPLDFAIPMVFLVLLVPALKDRPGIAAAATAGVSATVLGFLPANIGLFVSALAGVAVGTVLALRNGLESEVIA